jgi:S-ribosylhomocysteine lyase LuxS involved in autoinducer biosynthesis
MISEKKLKIKNIQGDINIKKQGIKTIFPTFYVELKAESNNKNIYEVRSLLQCKVKFKPSFIPKCEIPECNNYQQYGLREVFASVKRDASSAQKIT